MYIASNENKRGFFKPLNSRFEVFTIHDFHHLFNASALTAYQRALVDYGISFRATKKVETFNDLTHDPKSGRPIISVPATKKAKSEPAKPRARPTLPPSLRKAATAKKPPTTTKSLKKPAAATSTRKNTKITKREVQKAQGETLDDEESEKPKSKPKSESSNQSQNLDPAAEIIEGGIIGEINRESNEELF